MTPPKKASGANIAEWQRGKGRMQLRWDNELIAAVKAAAEQEKLDASEWLARLARQAIQIV